MNHGAGPRIIQGMKSPPAVAAARLRTPRTSELYNNAVNTVARTSMSWRAERVMSINFSTDQTTEVIK